MYRRVQYDEDDTYNVRLVDVVFKSSVAELKTDDIQQSVSVLINILIIFHPVLHRHLKTFLCVHVHHIQDTTRTCK